ncbi:hypothetical protein TNCV_3616091 [Trichonephila clavipes]|nr:hypothetical protein TNCV_3616091 [Trichonephila clavipes]
MDSGRSTSMLKRKWCAQVQVRAHRPAYSPVDYSRPFLHGPWHPVASKSRCICVPLPKPYATDCMSTVTCKGTRNRSIADWSTQGYTSNLVLSSSYLDPQMESGIVHGGTSFLSVKE